METWTEITMGSDELTGDLVWSVALWKRIKGGPFEENSGEAWCEGVGLTYTFAMAEGLSETMLRAERSH